MDGAVGILSIDSHLPHELWRLALSDLEHQSAIRVGDRCIEIDIDISTGKQLYNAPQEE